MLASHGARVAVDRAGVKGTEPMNQLTRPARVRRAVAGQPVDRPPVSFWAHNFAQENTAEDLAAETVRVYRQYGWDFIKIQSRASSFAEMWGNTYAYSDAVATPSTLTHWAVHSVEELAALRPVDPTTDALGEQLEALRLIRREVGPDVPIQQTVFAPAMVLAALTNSNDALLAYLRQAPEATHAALAVLTDTLSGYAHAAIANGADGIFLAIKAAAQGQMTRQEYAEFGLPYDRAVLAAAADGWFNMLHLCGEHLYVEVADGLPTPLLSYDALAPGNPSLSEMAHRTRRTVVGGVSPKPQIRTMSPAVVSGQVAAALAETGGTRLVIGPGCSISPDTPAENLFAARTTVEQWAAGRGEVTR
jgi:uroporphyrinogen decarboxylase